MDAMLRVVSCLKALNSDPKVQGKGDINANTRKVFFEMDPMEASRILVDAVKFELIKEQTREIQ